MAATSGPKMSNKGLKFYFDMNNMKSWNPNVITNTDLNIGWSKDYCTSIQWDDYPPPAGIDSQVVSFIDSNNDGSGYWYCYGDYAPQVPNVTYAVSVWARTVGLNCGIQAYTADNAETGRIMTETRTIIGNGVWQRLEFTPFLNPANSQSNSLSFFFIPLPPGQRCWLCAPQMTSTNFHLPFRNIKGKPLPVADLIGNNIITPTSIVYNADGTFSFNGTSTRIDVPGLVLSGPRSMFLWVYYNAITGLSEGYSLSGIQESSAFSYIGIIEGGQGYFYAGNATGGVYNAFYNINQWYYIGFVLTADGTVKLYKNGVLVDTKFGALGNASTLTFQIGAINSRYFHNGKIGSCAIFNRSLSELEVAQNFNAHRQRYGL
jgi:hypothetical protein